MLGMETTETIQIPTPFPLPRVDICYLDTCRSLVLLINLHSVAGLAAGPFRNQENMRSRQEAAFERGDFLILSWERAAVPLLPSIASFAVAVGWSLPCASFQDHEQFSDMETSYSFHYVNWEFFFEVVNLIIHAL